ncbi:MAG: hypothetical protein MZW92_75295 [Comamonadaceae bacterium]|nr:hypothetical protein [Comamonadaceae bacterium]
MGAPTHLASAGALRDCNAQRGVAFIRERPDVQLFPGATDDIVARPSQQRLERRVDVDESTADGANRNGHRAVMEDRRGLFARLPDDFLQLQAVRDIFGRCENASHFSCVKCARRNSQTQGLPAAIATWPRQACRGRQCIRQRRTTRCSRPADPGTFRGAKFD